MLDKKEIKLCIDCVELAYKDSLELEKKCNDNGIYNDLKFSDKRFEYRELKVKLIKFLKHVKG